MPRNLLTLADVPGGYGYGAFPGNAAGNLLDSIQDRRYRRERFEFEKEGQRFLQEQTSNKQAIEAEDRADRKEKEATEDSREKAKLNREQQNDIIGIASKWFGDANPEDIDQMKRIIPNYVHEVISRYPDFAKGQGNKKTNGEEMMLFGSTVLKDLQNDDENVRKRAVTGFRDIQNRLKKYKQSGGKMSYEEWLKREEKKKDLAIEKHNATKKTEAEKRADADRKTGEAKKLAKYKQDLKKENDDNLPEDKFTQQKKRDISKQVEKGWVDELGFKDEATAKNIEKSRILANKYHFEDGLPIEKAVSQANDEVRQEVKTNAALKKIPGRSKKKAVQAVQALIGEVPNELLRDTLKQKEWDEEDIDDIMEKAGADETGGDRAREKAIQKLKDAGQKVTEANIKYVMDRL